MSETKSDCPGADMGCRSSNAAVPSAGLRLALCSSGAARRVTSSPPLEFRNLQVSQQKPPMTLPRSASVGLKDHSQVDMLGVVSNMSTLEQK